MVAGDLNMTLIPHPSVPKEEEATMTYLKYAKIIRPDLVKANQGIEPSKVNALIGAMWQDYKVIKELNNPSSSTKKQGTKKSKRNVKKKRKTYVSIDTSTNI